MYICICNAINERQVLEAVSQGASTLPQLQAELGVATACGCCAETAQEYLPGGRYANDTPDAAAGTMVQEAANDEVVFTEVIACRA